MWISKIKRKKLKIRLQLYCYSKIQIQLYQLHWKFNTGTSNSIEIKLRTNLLMNNWRYNNRVLKLKLRSIGFLAFSLLAINHLLPIALFYGISLKYSSLYIPLLPVALCFSFYLLLIGLYRQLKWCTKGIRAIHHLNTIN
jgi:hypothetical protein